MLSQTNAQKEKLTRNRVQADYSIADVPKREGHGARSNIDHIKFIYDATLFINTFISFIEIF